MSAPPKKIGRPKGSGAGLDVQIGLRLPPAMLAKVEAAAEARGLDRSAMLREIVGNWARRQPEGAEGGTESKKGAVR